MVVHEITSRTQSRPDSSALVPSQAKECDLWAPSLNVVWKFRAWEKPLRVWARDSRQQSSWPCKKPMIFKSGVRPQTSAPSCWTLAQGHASFALQDSMQDSSEHGQGYFACCLPKSSALLKSTGEFQAIHSSLVEGPMLLETEYLLYE